MAGGSEQREGVAALPFSRQRGCDVALIWDGSLVVCDNPSCGTSERIPPWITSDGDATTSKDEWLVGRAWTKIAGRHYCPEHW
jgi:hypothetical protein